MQYWDATPITGASTRIRRGFSRIGIAGAVLVALCGAGITWMASIDQYNRNYWAADPVVFDPATDKAYKTGPSGGKVETNYFDQFDNPPPPGFEIVRHPNLFRTVTTSQGYYAANTAAIGLGISGVLALVAYGFFRGVGWLIAGFTRD